MRTDDLFTPVFVRLKERARYSYLDSESGSVVWVELPKGASVLVRGLVREEYGHAVKYVLGTSRPTIHGGGVHAHNATDPNTGVAITPSPIVDAYECNDVIIRAVRNDREKSTA